MAVKALKKKNHAVIPLGNRKGEIAGIHIETEPKAFDGIHTVTMYLNPMKQIQYKNYLLEKIKPRRIIFNPGAENAALAEKARELDIEIRHACTLVMLDEGNF